MEVRIVACVILVQGCSSRGSNIDEHDLINCSISHKMWAYWGKDFTKISLFRKLDLVVLI
jgi:hypothetical protein